LGERRLPLGPGRLLVGRARDEGDADLVLADLRPVVILVPVELVLAIEAGQAPARPARLGHEVDGRVGDRLGAPGYGPGNLPDRRRVVGAARDRGQGEDGDPDEGSKSEEHPHKRALRAKIGMRAGGPAAPGRVGSVQYASEETISPLARVNWAA